MSLNEIEYKAYLELKKENLELKVKLEKVNDQLAFACDDKSRVFKMLDIERRRILEFRAEIKRLKGIVEAFAPQMLTQNPRKGD